MRRREQLEKLVVRQAQYDPSSVVRISAIKALKLDPVSSPESEGDDEKDEEDEITLPSVLALISRIRDVTQSVRSIALTRLLSVPFSRLSPGDRVLILRTGLTDKCAATRTHAERVLGKWLKECTFSLSEVLKGLDPTVNPEVCTKACRVMMEAESGNNAVLEGLSAPEVKMFTGIVRSDIESAKFTGRCAPGSMSSSSSSSSGSSDVLQVTVEKALVLRVKCEMISSDETISSTERQQILEEYLPDTPVICGIVRRHLSLHCTCCTQGDRVDPMDPYSGQGEDYRDEHSFICQQMLILSKHCDFQEDTGRKMWVSLLVSLLSSASIPDDLVEDAIRSLAVSHQHLKNGEEEYMNSVLSIIDTVSDYDACSSSLDADEAAFRQLRIVSIVGVVLQYTKRKASDPMIERLGDQILPAIASSDPVVRQCGVGTLGKYSMLSPGVCEEYTPVLMSIASARAEIPDVRGKALLGMGDLCLLYKGVEDDVETIGEEERRVCLEGVLEEEVDGGGRGMQSLAGEVALKLLLRSQESEEVVDVNVDADVDGGNNGDSPRTLVKNAPRLLAKLLLTFFDSAFSSSFNANSSSPTITPPDSDTQNDHADTFSAVGSPGRLQQLLALFFPAYLATGGEGRRRHLVQAVTEAARIRGEGWGPGGWGKKTPDATDGVDGVDGDAGEIDKDKPATDGGWMSSKKTEVEVEESRKVAARQRQSSRSKRGAAAAAAAAAAKAREVKLCTTGGTIDKLITYVSQLLDSGEEIVELCGKTTTTTSSTNSITLLSEVTNYLISYPGLNGGRTVGGELGRECMKGLSSVVVPSPPSGGSGGGGGGAGAGAGAVEHWHSELRSLLDSFGDLEDALVEGGGEGRSGGGGGGGGVGCGGGKQDATARRYGEKFRKEVERGERGWGKAKAAAVGGKKGGRRGGGEEEENSPLPPPPPTTTTTMASEAEATLSNKTKTQTKSKTKTKTKTNSKTDKAAAGTTRTRRTAKTLGEIQL